MSFNLFKPKRFLGIDIGTSCIKMVELRQKGQGYSLENYGEADVSLTEGRSFRIFEKNTLLLSNDDLASTIKNVCQEAGIKTKDVNFSIPDFSTFFTIISLPQMTQGEIEEAIKYEVR